MPLVEETRGETTKNMNHLVGRCITKWRHYFNEKGLYNNPHHATWSAHFMHTSFCIHFKNYCTHMLSRKIEVKPFCKSGAMDAWFLTFVIIILFCRIPDWWPKSHHWQIENIKDIYDLIIDAISKFVKNTLEIWTLWYHIWDQQNYCLYTKTLTIWG